MDRRKSDAEKSRRAVHSFTAVSVGAGVIVVVWPKSSRRSTGCPAEGSWPTFTAPDGNVSRPVPASGAAWEEIDIPGQVWRIPGQVWRIPPQRMKAGVEHRVPLSGQALDVLGKASALRDESGLVFPSPLRPGSPMSDMTLTKVLRSTGLAESATVHGFRSSFKNWTLEQTDTPWAVSESALAHILGNSTEQAYARSDLFERRRALMQQWADYLTG